MKKKNNIFLSLMALFTILVAVLIYSCGKNASSSIDTPNNEANQNSKFAANEWPVFAISRAQLSNFIQGDVTEKDMTIVLRSDDWDSPKSSMRLVAFGERGTFEFLRQVGHSKVILEGPLTIGNNLISLNTIINTCTENGQWKDNFEYLQLTPVESKTHKSYLSFKLTLYDKNGTPLQSSGNTIEDESGESNPRPPYPPCEGTGQSTCGSNFHCLNGTCTPNN